jgi:hypothetical protein
MDSFLGNVFFALLVGCVGFATAYYLCKNRRI